MPIRRVLAAVLAAGIALSATACSAENGRPTPSASTQPTYPAATSAPVGPARTVVAVGDSLSLGTNACDRYSDCPAVSWSIGDDREVGSVAARLRAATGGDVRTVEVARAGAGADDLDRQVGLAIEEQPDLVTLLIGANDVCRPDVASMTSTADFAGSVEGALDRLTEATDAVVLLASVPDVTALLPTAAADTTARFIWSRGRICPTALDEPRSTSVAAETRREAVRERVDEYNRSLEAACEARARCVYDQGALAAYTPTLEQLSALDAFHPSVAGLRELAALEWAALTGAPVGRGLLD